MSKENGTQRFPGMKCFQSNGRSTLWSRFQRWRAMRMLARIPRLETKAKALYAKAVALLDKFGSSR